MSTVYKIYSRRKHIIIIKYKSIIIKYKRKMMMMVLKGLVSPVVTIPAHQLLHVSRHDGVVPVPDMAKNED